MLALIPFIDLSVDLTLAIGLVIAVVGVILLHSIGVLPKKSIPYVLLAIVGAFGFAWFRDRQARGLRKKLEEKEKALEELEQRAEASRQEFDAEHAKLDELKADFEKSREALKVSMLELKAEGEEERERIANLQGEELDNEFDKLLGTLGGGS